MNPANYKVDLHTHSVGSPDGGLTLSDYRHSLESGLLDYIAITDHDTVENARAIKAALGELGERIIVGEEIMTNHGELIGLFLGEAVEPGMTPVRTVQAIHVQGGLVYVPHPFEVVRSGISVEVLNNIEGQVDIVEAWNGRAVFGNRSKAAEQWARQNEKAVAASSDAHGRFGWGRTYSVITGVPSVRTLVGQLAHASYATHGVGVGILYPKLNRLKRALGQRRRLR